MDANLIIFLVWMVTIIILAAMKNVPAFNREFTALMMAGNFLFYKLIDQGTFVVVLLTFLGLRTGQKYMEMKNNKKNNKDDFEEFKKDFLKRNNKQ